MESPPTRARPQLDREHGGVERIRARAADLSQ